MDYTPRINQAIADCFRDGKTERDWIERAVRRMALNDDDTLYRQLKDYTASAIELAYMIQEATAKP